MVLVLSLLACKALPEPAEGSVFIDLDPTAVAAPTGRLIGWNLGRGTLYADETDALHPEWRTDERVKAIEALSTIRGPGDTDPWMRFSGMQIDGTLGDDGYHFYDFVEPGRGISPDDNMAVFQYMALMDESGAEPLVTLNFGSGTAEEAAGYARHLNSTDNTLPDVQSRTFWGRNEPYEQHLFEIGNESYGFWNTGNSGSGDYSYANPTAVGGGDPDWHGRSSELPEDYAARALAYIDAVNAVTPEARFWVPVSQADFEGWGGPSESVPKLAPLLEHPSVTAVVVHHYQVDDSLTLGLGDAGDPNWILAGSSFLGRGYDSLRTELDGLNRSEPLEIAITEYGVAGFFSGPGFTLGRTAAMGLGTADMLIDFANRDIAAAAQHVALNWDPAASDLLLEDWYKPYRFEDGEPVELPATRVTGLVAEHLLESRLNAPFVDNPTLRGGDGGDGSPLFEFDALSGAAFVNPDGGLMTLMVLNRDFEHRHPLRISVPDGWIVDAAVSWEPEDWSIPVYPEDNDEGDITFGPFLWRSYGEVIDLEMRRHSLIAMRFRRI